MPFAPLQQPITAGSPSSADDLTPSSNLPSTPAAYHNTHPMITRLKDGIVKPRHIVDLAILHQSPLHQLLFASKEPRGYKTAAKNPRWLFIMEDEMRALRSNHTWDLVTRLRESNVVCSKWVNRIKYNFDGTIDRFKARLVA